MAHISANNLYSYDKEYHGLTLSKWVELTHAHMGQESGWSYYPLKMGSFGFDNILMSLAYVFDHVENFQETTIDSVSDWVHQGWVSNYTYWRDHQPWLPAKTSLYTKAAKALGDERRNLCAKTDYKDLPEDEKIKDQMIAKFLISKLT